MPIIPLSPPTARLLTASHTVYSFESAVQSVLHDAIRHNATEVTLTVLPQPLRFTSRDNRPPVSKQTFHRLLHAPTNATPSTSTFALASLATTSAVELRIRTPQYAALHTVRAARILDRRDVSTARAHTILPHCRFQVDVWETFVAVPVRRTIEQNRPPDAILSAVRQAVVAHALANPTVAVTLHGPNDTVVFRTPRHGALCRERVQLAFGDAQGLLWCRVESNDASVGVGSVDGLVAIQGLSHSRLQLIAVGGQPSTNVALHRAAKCAWRAWLSRAPRLNTSVRRFAAFVLNCRLANDHKTPLPSVLREDVWEPLVKQLVFDALSAPNNRNNRRENRRQEKVVVPTTKRTLETLSISRKRQRFAEALVPSPAAKLMRTSGSSWGETVGRRAQSVQVRTKDDAKEQLARFSCERRPATADGVESAFKQQVPGWADRWIGERPQASRRCGLRTSGDTVGGRSAKRELLLDKKRVTMNREAFGKLRIVGQVDRKFIVVVDEGTTMYAIDQHAASERYLYERYMRKATPARMKSWTLQHAKKVALTAEQRAIAEEKRALLGSWGWTIGMTAVDGAVDLLQVPHMSGLGEQDVVLGEAEQLRSYLNSLLDGAVGGTPLPLAEAVASAACHAAVRFGDVLTREQCEAMVWALGGCANPFVCAHGRPSVVPLVVFEAQGDE